MNFKRYVTSNSRKANSKDSIVYYALIDTDFAKNTRKKAVRSSKIYRDVSSFIARMLNVKVETLSLTDQAQFISNLIQAMAVKNISAETIQTLLK